mgnify:CR=1 FL=1|jgi:predicted nucleic acid-binding Zn ribbon protein
MVEIFHMMSDESPRPCETCGEQMQKQIGMGYFASKGFKPTREDYREIEHKKKVKDFERAVRKRKQLFGRDSVGDPNDRPDPKHQVKPNHIMKQGKTVGGRQMEVDKQELVKALAKDDVSVKLAQNALKKKGAI